MITNLVKSKWAKKQVALNSFLSIPNSFTAEIMSEQGYDALTVDYQHGMIGFNDLLTMIQSIRHSGVTPICRVSSLDHAVISKVMDAGAHVNKFKELTNQENDESSKDTNPSSY